MARSWKDRCAVAHAPGENSPDNSSARVRQAAKQRVETAYAHAPLMLAHDRRVLDVPLEERLQSRTSELLAWAKTIPVINRSVRDALNYKLVIKTSAVTSPKQVVTTGDTAVHHQYRAARPKQQHHQYRAPLVLKSNTTSTEPCCPDVPILDRRRFQSARTRIATLSYDIRQYFPGIADSAT
jgi:hypothetical protein